MILHVDKLQPDDLGGGTKDMEKIRHVFNKLNIDFDELKKTAPHNIPNPFGALNAGRYIVIFQFNKTFTKGSMMFMNYKTDLSKHFDSFVDTLPSKVVADFYKMQILIRQKGVDALNLVQLTDEPLLTQRVSRN
jgi:hypothetical protein